MSLPKHEAWFPAKRYGYGWGFPQRWQGWVVMLLFFAALLLGAAFLRTRPTALIIYSGACAAAMIAVCAWKGEPARWRWGGDD